MFLKKKKDNSKKESVQKIQRKLEKLEDTGSVSSFTQRLRETWRKQNLGQKKRGHNIVPSLNLCQMNLPRAYSYFLASPYSIDGRGKPRPRLVHASAARGIMCLYLSGIPWQSGNSTIPHPVLSIIIFLASILFLAHTNQISNPAFAVRCIALYIFFFSCM